MIQITDKHNCCGCSSCVQACPKQCIDFKEDEHGFKYPVVNIEKCVNCYLCESVCPCLNQDDFRIPKNTYAVINSNEATRSNSSSGGVFALLSENVIEAGGVVFGAKYDEDWQVKHDYTETKECLRFFQGSKYVQSDIGNTYKMACDFLKANRMVLYSGTPCQIAGLRKYLRKDYRNLIAVEVVCHGVPSPAVWRSYLLQINPQKKKITEINLRSKKRGWKHYSYLLKAGKDILVDEYAYESGYLQGFSLNLTLRPSCYSCPAKGLKSGADITLADCWGVETKPEIPNDDMGISAVLLNTPKGQDFFERINVKCYDLDYGFIKSYNPSIVSSPQEPYCRKLFWRLFPQYGINAVSIVSKKLTHNPFFRLCNLILTNIN